MDKKYDARLDCKKCLGVRKTTAYPVFSHLFAESREGHQSTLQNTETTPPHAFQLCIYPVCLPVCSRSARQRVVTTLRGRGTLRDFGPSGCKGDHATVRFVTLAVLLYTYPIGIPRDHLNYLIERNSSELRIWPIVTY